MILLIIYFNKHLDYLINTKEVSVIILRHWNEEELGKRWSWNILSDLWSLAQMRTRPDWFYTSPVRG